MNIRKLKKKLKSKTVNLFQFIEKGGNNILFKKDLFFIKKNGSQSFASIKFYFFTQFTFKVPLGRKILSMTKFVSFIK